MKVFFDDDGLDYLRCEMPRYDPRRYCPMCCSAVKDGTICTVTNGEHVFPRKERTEMAVEAAKGKRTRRPRRNLAAELEMLKLYCEANVMALDTLAAEMDTSEHSTAIRGRRDAYKDILSRLQNGGWK